MHRATRRFWVCFATLSEDIQNLARKNYALLKTNPQHPSLQFKKVGKLWSARVGLHHRALAAVTEDLDRALQALRSADPDATYGMVVEVTPPTVDVIR